MEDISELIVDCLKPFEKFQIEILDDKDQHYQLTSEIIVTGGDYLIISPPMFLDSYFDLPVNAVISVIFYRNEGIIFGHSKILAKQSGDEPRLKLSLPYNVELINRRRHKRYRLKLKSTIEYLINKNSSNYKVLYIETFDISTHGLSYFHNDPLGKYHKIKCSINLDNITNNPVVAECRYVQSLKKTVKGVNLYKIGLEFVKISGYDKERLHEKLFRRKAN